MTVSKRKIWTCDARHGPVSVVTGWAMTVVMHLVTVVTSANSAFWFSAFSYAFSSVSSSFLPFLHFAH
jgi:hypothetical protein